MRFKIIFQILMLSYSNISSSSWFVTNVNERIHFSLLFRIYHSCFFTALRISAYKLCTSLLFIFCNIYSYLYYCICTNSVNDTVFIHIFVYHILRICIHILISESSVIIRFISRLFLMVFVAFQTDIIDLQSKIARHIIRQCNTKVGDFVQHDRKLFVLQSAFAREDKLGERHSDVLPVRSTSGVEHIIMHIVPSQVKHASSREIQRITSAVSSDTKDEMCVRRPVVADITFKGLLLVYSGDVTITGILYSAIFR